MIWTLRGAGEPGGWRLVAGWTYVLRDLGSGYELMFQIDDHVAQECFRILMNLASFRVGHLDRGRE